ncbi:hypothetical protein FRC18_004329 [Serendipita sp. 400]|nr:hypothetical protein FRC18_004329 [Serendipita sp. 400]
MSTFALRNAVRNVSRGMAPRRAVASGVLGKRTIMTPTEVQYTASATATNGGRSGSVKINNDAKPPLDVSINLTPPKAMGGSGTGSNPEQLFSAGYASCYLGALSACARTLKRPKEEIERLQVEVKTSIGPTDVEKDGKGFALIVELVVKGLGDGGNEVIEAAHNVRITGGAGGRDGVKSKIVY